MKNLVLVVCVAFASNALALPSAAEFVNKGYICEVTVVANDLKAKAITQTIKRPIKAQGSHGGDPVTLQFEHHTVSVMADGTWRALSWRRGDQLVAELVTATVDPYKTHFVIIAYNPADPDEQTSLSCMPE